MRPPGVTQGGGALLAAGLLLLAIPLANASPAPPSVVIKSPRDGSVVHTNTVLVEGTATVSEDAPGQKVTASLNGKPLRVGVEGPRKYSFEATATLHKGANELSVIVRDTNSGETTQSVTVTYKPKKPTPPTTKQCVSDKKGDSHDHFTNMDIVQACAKRRGGRVIFSVTTAHRPPNIHDGFGNPAAPCIEYSKGARVEPHITPIQSCGDASLRGWTMHHWPKVPFSISGRTSTWKVPLKYLSKTSFQWRAYISDADHYRDTAPNKGYETFVIRGS
jgi:Glucodextranase, domain B